VTAIVRDRSALAAAGSGREGWRSHTFADGVRCLTLLGPLDVRAADRISTRISELVARGARELIVDARAIEPAGDQPALLAAVFTRRPASYQAVVLTRPGSALVDLLPPSVAVTASLTAAHRRLAGGDPLDDRDAASALPADQIPAGERRALAARQSQRWADRAAGEGSQEACTRVRSECSTVRAPVSL